MLNKLKGELLNKEMTLLEMDNTVLETVGGKSIFDYGREYWGEYENGKFNFSYLDEYNIYFDMVEDNDNRLEAIIKVTGIEVL